ncbi:hypothetical protein GCM10009804_45330 [Kribbella hippodromi]|uniref:Uncharacterized protein n=1 Tax=Kribbella hippodromi TaxID=434347 RepID=A0ABN2DU18_9ACTN
MCDECGEGRAGGAEVGAVASVAAAAHGDGGTWRRLQRRVVPSGRLRRRVVRTEAVTDLVGVTCVWMSSQLFNQLIGTEGRVVVRPGTTERGCRTLSIRWS